MMRTTTKTKTTTTTTNGSQGEFDYDYNIHGGRPRLDGKHNRSNQLLLQGNAYDNFVNTIRSQETLKDYDRALKRFMQYLNITDINNLLPPSIQNPQQEIIDYIVYLKKERSLGGISIASYIAGIVHFYTINDITLNRKRISAYIPEQMLKKKDRGYTIQEIAKLLQFCDIRDRAVVLLFASTGMRIGAVPDLKMGDVKRIEKYGLFRMTVYSGAKEEYICFCTPEAAKSIDEYLQYRIKCGEILTDDSPLFREQFDITDLEQIKKKPKKLTANAIVCSLRKRLDLAGILSIESLKEGELAGAGKKRKPIKRTHGFRKFVTTVMIDAQLNETRRYLLLGKSLPRQDDNYYRPKESDLLEEYLKVVDALTINEENRLKRKVVGLTIKTDRVDALQVQMDRLNRKLGLE